MKKIERRKMNRFTNKFHRDLRHPEKKEKKMQIVKTTIDTENGLLGEGEFRCAGQCPAETSRD